MVRIKKGLYVPGWYEGEPIPVDPKVLSGLIYGPSYVSLESALAYHGLIPERTEEITCVTSKRAKVFETPVGRFRYQPVNERAFACGVRLEQARGGNWLLAEPEKALCDQIAQVKSLSAVKDVASVLFEDFRIHEDGLWEFRGELLDKIARRYRRRNVSAFYRWWLKQRKGALSG